MSDNADMPINAGSAFFGFMGVSMALVLASIRQFMQTWEQPMALPRQAPASAASPSGDQESS